MRLFQASAMSFPVVTLTFWLHQVVIASVSRQESVDHWRLFLLSGWLDVHGMILYAVLMCVLKQTFPKHLVGQEVNERMTGDFHFWMDLVRVTGLEGGFIKPLVIFGVKCAQINEKNISIILNCSAGANHLVYEVPAFSTYLHGMFKKSQATSSFDVGCSNTFVMPLKFLSCWKMQW